MALNKRFDLLAVGELLIDLLGHDHNTDLAGTTLFQKQLGGSPANLSMNLAKQGKQTALAATIGNDGFGDFLKSELEKAKVDTAHIQQLDHYQTSLAIVSRSTDTPDFSIYRQTDHQITTEQLPNTLLANTKVFHTTCFALSKQPAQKVILEAAKRANVFGVQLSIDLNYAVEIWPEKQNAIDVVEQYLTLKPLVKLSEDDFERLYANRFKSFDQLLAYFQSFELPLVCFTKGKAGCLIATSDGIQEFNAPEVKKVDHATGAGDAFWSGFLAAYLDKKDIVSCVENANRIAAIKLQTFGALPILH